MQQIICAVTAPNTSSKNLKVIVEKAAHRAIQVTNSNARLHREEIYGQLMEGGKKLKRKRNVKILKYSHKAKEKKKS